MINIVGETKIDFLGKRYIAFSVSGVLMILGFFALFQVMTGKANLGIDFAGGTAVQVKFEKPVALNEVRKIVESAGFRDPDLQDFPAVNKVLIRIKAQEENLGGISEKLVKALSDSLPGNAITIDSTTEIGPKVGSRLKADAFWAVMMATVFILIYIAWRFQFKFGVGATLATFHDVMAVLGIFHLMGKEMNLVFLSALLTIAGYSLTDTVVVFDRIRENMAKMKRGMTMIDVMNLSVNEVLSRTLIVSLTTLFAAVALFFFGGEVLHDFSFVIILGIIVGTLSSIFVASPVVLAWEQVVDKAQAGKSKK